MDKVKVTITEPDGTERTIEGSSEDVARILRDLDRKVVVAPPPAIIVIPAPANPYPLTLPFTPGPVWAPSPTIAPSIPWWPVVTCQAPGHTAC